MEQNLKDKLPPAVTYNRPPTQQRAPDPGRFRSIDVLPENAQNDPEYQRMVRDIEALQQRQGWLAGRGAFDKEDLLYLRDREQRERLTEQEQRDMEAAAYATARARIEQQQQEAAAARLRAATTAKPSKPQSRSIAPVVKVKKHHSHDKQQEQSHQQQQQQAEPDHQQGGRDSKRQKVDDGVDHAAAAAVNGSGDGHPEFDSANVSKASTQQARDHQQQQPQEDEQPLVGAKGDQDSGPAPALEGFLGVYCSESESEEDKGMEGVNQEQQQRQEDSRQRPQQGCPVQLPSAAELLEQELHSSLAPMLSAEAETDASKVHEVAGAATAYEQHTAWI